MQRPHVHVFGDLAELQVYYLHDKLPDHLDPSLAPYRKPPGLVHRALQGGAWSLAQYVRAALGDVLKCDNEWTDRFGYVHAKGGLYKFLGETKAGWRTQVSMSADHFNLNLIAHCNEWSTRTTDDGVYIKCNFKGGIPKPLNDFIKKADVQQLLVEAFGDPNKSELSSITAIAYASHEMKGGEVTAFLSNSREEMAESFEVTFSANDEWPPSFCMWPRRKNVRVAIRQVNLVKLLADAREKSEAKGVLIPPGSYPPASILWEALSPDEKYPLNSFLAIRNPNTSRMVLVLDKSWSDRIRTASQSPNAVLAHDKSESVAGYLMLMPSRDDWDVWHSGCRISHEPAFGPFWEIHTSRLQFKFGDNSDSKPSFRVFGFPISIALARLFQPNKRPAPDFIAPDAIVTTSQLINTDTPYVTDPGPVVRPAWQISSDSPGEPLRLRRAQAYQFPNNWFEEVAERYAHRDDDQASNYESITLRTEPRSTQITEWGLSRHHQHGEFIPQWVPENIIRNSHQYKYLSFVDLDFGFRRYSSDLTQDSAISDNLTDGPHTRPEQFVKELRNRVSFPRPDWWIPLQRWLMGKEYSFAEEHLASRGWIVGVLGRTLPLKYENSRESVGAWEEGNLWHVLRKAELEVTSANGEIQMAPVFRDRVVVIVSGNLLRASGARISDGLSWERTSTDCLRELEQNEKLKPLCEFRHLVVRFGSSGAIHVVREDIINSKDNKSNCNANAVTRVVRSLHYDAINDLGFRRDPNAGHVIGANSVFAARILQSIIAHEDRPTQDVKITEAIRQSLVDCQELYKRGYGRHIGEGDAFRIDYSGPEDVLNPLNKRPLSSA